MLQLYLLSFTKNMCVIWSIVRIFTRFYDYHFFISNPEVTVYNGGMVDSLYVNVGETLNVKLKVDQYKMISSNDDPCIEQVNYSANEVTWL